MSAMQQALLMVGSAAPAVAGQITFGGGTNNWVCPAGVTSVSFVMVSGGYSNNNLNGNFGGRLGYVNNHPVTPGASYTIVVDNSPGGSTPSVVAFGRTLTTASSDTGTFTAKFSGGAGGNGRIEGEDILGGGGGGAAGYSGNGGAGAAHNGSATAGAGGAGGGGGRGSGLAFSGAAGGGVGILGEGASGAAGAVGTGGGGGSGGANGGNEDAAGGQFGGGPGGSAYNSFINGGQGIIRIIWPGDARLFPSTRTADE